MGASAVRVLPCAQLQGPSRLRWKQQPGPSLTCAHAYLAGPGWWGRAGTRWSLSSAARNCARALHTGTRRWPGCRIGPGCSTCPSPWQRCSRPGPGGTAGSPPLGIWWWSWPGSPSSRPAAAFVLPYRWLATFSLCAPMAFPWCVHTERGRETEIYRATLSIRLDSHPYDLI